MFVCVLHARRVTMTDWLLYQQSTCAMQTLILVWHFPKFRIFTFHIWLEIVLFFPITHFPGHNSLLLCRVSLYTRVATNCCWYVFIARSFKIFFGSNTHELNVCASYRIRNDVPKWKAWQRSEKELGHTALANKQVYKWRKQLNCRKILGNQNIVFKLDITIIMWPSFVQSQKLHQKWSKTFALITLAV